MDIGSAFVWLASLYFVCDVWQSCLDDVVLLYNNNNNITTTPMISNAP